MSQYFSVKGLNFYRNISFARTILKTITTAVTILLYKGMPIRNRSEIDKIVRMFCFDFAQKKLEVHYGQCVKL